MIGRVGRDSKERGHNEYTPKFETKTNFESGMRSDSNDSHPSRSLWVGNLSPQVTESILAEQFLRFGELDNISMYPDRGYAFVNFKKDEDASFALRELQGAVIAGFALKIEFAKAERSSSFSLGRDRTPHERAPASRGDSFSRRDSRVHGFGSESFESDRLKENKIAEPSEVLWVGFPVQLNLDENTIRRAFSPYGELEKVTTFPGRSYAFVKYRSVASACKAKEALHGKLFDNPRVHICFSRSEMGVNEQGKTSPGDKYMPTKPASSIGYGNPDINDQAGDLPRASYRLGPSLGDTRTNEVARSPIKRPATAYAKHDKLSLDVQHSEMVYPQKLHEFSRNRHLAGVDVTWRGGSPVKMRREASLIEEPWDLPEEDHMFREKKRLKPGYLAEKQPGRFPFPDPFNDKRVMQKPFRASPRPEIYDDENGSPPIGSNSSYHPEGCESWGPNDGFDRSFGPPAKTYREKLSSELRPLPLGKEWEWQGTIAKGGSPICRARCFPVGKVLDMMLPEFLNCTARTGLDMLVKHFSQAASSWIVFFTPETDADIVYYNEFMHYLGEKERAAVAKLGEKTTLFLVPPSEFSEKVLRVPGKLSISGVILKFQNADGDFGSFQHPMESMNLKQLPHMHQQTEDPNYHDDPPYMKLPSPEPPKSSWSRRLGGTSSSDDGQPVQYPSHGLHNNRNNNIRHPGTFSTPVSLAAHADSSSAAAKRSSDSIERKQVYHQDDEFPPYRQQSWNTSHDASARSHASSRLTGWENPSERQMRGKGSFASQYSPDNPTPLTSSSPPWSKPSPPQVPSLPTEQLAQLASLLARKQQSETLQSNENANQVYMPSENTHMPKASYAVPNYNISAPVQSSAQSSFGKIQHQQQNANQASVYPQTHPESSSVKPPQIGKDDGEGDPEKRLQATLQLAAALLQQIQQQQQTNP